MGNLKDSKVDYWLTDDGIELIKSWSRNTFSKSEIADRMGVNLNTLLKWQKQYVEINDAINVTRELVDFQVENAVLKAALGYKTKEIKVTIGKKVVNGEMVEMLKETTVKEVPPNIKAAMFWLNNRKFDDWKLNRDKVVEVDPDDSQVTITIQRGNKAKIDVYDEDEENTDEEENVEIYDENGDVINSSATFSKEELEKASGDVSDELDEDESDLWDEWEQENEDGDE